MLHHALRSAVISYNDPNFENVIMLLPGNGTNGAQNNTFLDSSTNNLTITRNGNTTQGTFSPYGNLWSNYFDGSGDYLSITNTSTAIRNWNANDFTVEAWIFPNTLTGLSVDSSGIFLPTMIGNMSPTASTNYWSFGPNSSGTVSFYYFTGVSRNVTSTATITVNQWNHVAFTRTSSGITLFVNGTASSTTAVVGIPQTATGTPVIMGQYNNTALNAFVSQIRIINGTALYSGDFTPPAVPLTAVTNTSLLTCQSNRFVDNSSNNFTITVNGNVRVQRFSPFETADSYSSSIVGGGGYFDGTGDYLSAASNAVLALGTGDYTVEGWAYITGTATNQNIVDMRGTAGTGNPIRIAKNGSNLNLGYAASDSQISTTFPALNQWFHFAAVRSGTSVAFFLNGSRVGTATDSTNLAQAATQIGTYAAGTAPITGYLSDIRIVKGTSVYDPASTTLTVPTAPLTAITNTSLLVSFINAAIVDNAMQNALETVGNAQISTTQSKWGGSSIAFDGTGDYLIAGGNLPLYALSTGDFTIECWAYFNSFSTGPVIIDMRNGTTAAVGPVIYVETTAVLYYFTANANRITGSTLSTGQWYHIAASRVSGSTRLFVDGTQVGSTYSDTNNYINNVPYIGRQSDATGRGLNGYINGLRITRGVGRYSAAFTPPLLPFPTR